MTGNGFVVGVAAAESDTIAEITMAAIFIFSTKVAVEFPGKTRVPSLHQQKRRKFFNFCGNSQWFALGVDYYIL